MTIPTLSSNLYLYKVNKYRFRFATRQAKQKAAWLILFIVACLAIVIYTLLIYK